MRRDRTDPKSSELARGPAKAGDIDATRRSLGEAERRHARDQRLGAARRERELARGARRDGTERSSG